MAKHPLYTEAEVADAMATAGGNMAKAARLLSGLGRGEVTRQLLRTWLNRMDHTETGEAFSRASTLAKARNAQAENATLRRDNRALIAAVGTKEALLDACERIIAKRPRGRRFEPIAFVGPQAGTPMTVELLLSDLQIGKLSPTYNTEIAFRRLREYARAALFQIEQKRLAGYRVERIVLAFVGDIIESDKKHENSGKATDSTTAEQIYDATSGLFELVVEPLAKLGLPMTIAGIVGNHDWDGHGMNMFEPGKSMLSWPIYKLIEMLTKRVGYRNVEFLIPEGTYTMTDIYGQAVLYEHGYGVANNEAALKKHKVNRSEQEGRHITYLRLGDKHTVTSFNAGQLVVNGAFFGSGPGGSEYSGIAGYSSIPGQWMGFHVPRKAKAMLTIYDTFVIQLGDIQ
jgi:hypothetical protein